MSRSFWIATVSSELGRIRLRPIIEGQVQAKTCALPNGRAPSLLLTFWVAYGGRYDRNRMRSYGLQSNVDEPLCHGIVHPRSATYMAPDKRVLLGRLNAVRPLRHERVIGGVPVP